MEVTTVVAESPGQPVSIPDDVAEVAEAEATAAGAAAAGALAAEAAAAQVAAATTAESLAAPAGVEPPAAPGVSSADPSLQNFLQQWGAYTAALTAQGFFRDESFDIHSTDVEQYGVVKRANLNLARERPDILHALPKAKVVHLAQQELPYDERKVGKQAIYQSILSLSLLPGTCLCLSTDTCSV